jgi:hypothetical protein
VCVSVSIYLLLNIQTRQISAEDLGFLTSGGAARGGGGGALCANLLDYNSNTDQRQSRNRFALDGIGVCQFHRFQISARWVFTCGVSLMSEFQLPLGKGCSHETAEY